MAVRQSTIDGSMDQSVSEKFGRIFDNMKIGGIAALILMFFGITIAWGAWYTVGQNERAVLLRWGAIVDDNVEPGIHWKTPWIESYDTVSIATHTQVYGAGEEKMEAYSRDQQPAHFRISVIWHIPTDKVGEVYWRYGGFEGLKERVLDRLVQKESKVVFGTFNAITVIQERERFNKEIWTALEEAAKNDPLIIESVQVEDVQFSDDYIRAVKERMVAEVQVSKLRQMEEQQKVNANITVINAEAEAKQTVARAKGEADARVAKATAEALAIEMQGKALAAALQLKGKALAENPKLVDMEIAQRWTGILPTTMVPGGTLPILDVNKMLTPTPAIPIP